LEVAHATDADLDALRYFFEIDTADTFNSFMFKQSAELPQQAGSTTSWLPPALLDNTVYHWRVRAFDGAAYSSWRNGSFFVNTANDAPGKPAVDHPGDLSEIKAQQPILTVKPAGDADLDELSYEFEIYADSELAEGVTDAFNVGPAWQVEETLEDNRSYFWRARAVDIHGAVGPWSVVATFFVNTALDAPDAPVLNNPISGGTDTSLTPTLSVFNVDDPDRDDLSYEFELYSDSGLSQLIRAGRVDQGHLITSWTVPSALDDGGIYYWRVRADDGHLTSSWMPTAVLEINTAGADTTYQIHAHRKISARSRKQLVVAVTAPESSIHKTTVEVSPGALKRDVTFIIGNVTNPPALPVGTRAVGEAIEFGPSGLFFAEPLIIRLPYTAAALKRARIIDPAELEVFYYDTTILSWAKVAVENVDPVNRLVNIKTNHFSMYTIGASAAAVTADGSKAGGGGSGASGCFISTMGHVEAAFLLPDRSVSSVFSMLMLIGLLWLGKRW
jgi:hypothetical protein